MKFYEAEIFCKLSLLVLFTLSCILICTFPLSPMQHIQVFCVWHITGSAVALHCCKAHSKINRKMGNSTPCKIATPENFNLKLCIRDYVGEATRHANFGSNRYSGGFSPYRRNITTLWLFVLTVLSCPVLSFFFLGNAPRSNRWTDFHALWLKRRVSAQGSAFWGSGWWVTSSGGNIPPKPPKNGRE